MPNTKNIKIGGRVIGLAVGHNKSGKTTGLATFPGPVKIFNFDGPGRMEPIIKMWPELEIEYENVGVKTHEVRGDPDSDFNVTSYLDFCKRFEALQDYCPWGTIIIDSFTSLSTTSVNFQLMARMGGSFNLAGMKTTKGGLPIASWDEFNGETTTISMILDVAKILPCHVWMTAHPITKTETDKDGKVLRKYTTLASFGNKVNQIVPGYFSEIWRFRTEPNLDPSAKWKTQHKVFTIPEGEDPGATALPLPSVMDITGRKLYEVVSQELKAHNIRLETARILAGK